MLLLMKNVKVKLKKYKIKKVVSKK